MPHMEHGEVWVCVGNGWGRKGGRRGRDEMEVGGVGGRVGGGVTGR